MHGNVWNIHQVHDVDELKQRLTKVCHGLEQSVIYDAMDEWHKRLWASVHAKEGHFVDDLRALMLMFRNKSMIMCYTSTVLLLLIFCISQGSVVTHLRCGDRYGMSIVANLLLSSSVKEFQKSANIYQSYERISSSTLFMAHGVHCVAAVA